MKYSGNTVSNRCTTESVAEMTIRRGPASRSMNGELAGAPLTITRRPGMPRRSVAHSAASMSGPTRLNFASAAVERAVADQKQQAAGRRGFSCDRRSATMRRRFAAVAAADSEGVSLSVVTCDGSKPSRSISVWDSAFVQPLYCCA